MAKRKRTKGLTIDKGQYVKAVGYIASKSGKIQARRWYLGAVDDGPEAALTKADKLKAAWAVYRANGAMAWPDGVNPLADAFNPPSVEDKATGFAIDNTGLTVSKAKERYLDGIKGRYEAGQVTHAYYASESFNLQRGVELLGADKPLASIGANELTAAVLSLSARPLAKPRKGQKTTPKPISVKSAKTYLNSLKYFLDEMSKTETAPGSNQPVWAKPLRFEDIFRANQPKLTTAERDQLIANGEAEADAFTVDELARLYRAAPDRQRLWMALALNCGFANMELATLTVAQCVGLDGDAPKIKRFRGKTNIYAEWSLWPETTDLLRMFLSRDKRTNIEGPAILTEAGETLIAPRGMGRRDAVRSAWEHINAELPSDRRLSWKYLRKSGAKLIRHMPEIGGDDIAQMYLSQADDRGVLKHYSGRAWGKLTAATAQLHTLLAPMFKADAFHAVKTLAAKGKTAEAKELIKQIRARRNAARRRKMN